VIGPLLLGQATVLNDGPFDPAATYRVLERHAVTSLATAPTAYRALRAAGQPSRRLRLGHASSCGEPLNESLIAWAEEHLGVPVHDHYGQTETCIVAANHHHPALARPLRPGSMGHSTPGYRVVILDEADEEAPPGLAGQIAVDVEGSPLFFRGYFREEAESARRLPAGGRYFLTGDAGRQDEDGYLWFDARADDVIVSGGYRIGPFEVESALTAHEAVAEAAAVDFRTSGAGRSWRRSSSCARDTRRARRWRRPGGLRQDPSVGPRLPAGHPVRRRAAHDAERQGAGLPAAPGRRDVRVTLHDPW
jgi:acetyl-CoA synthetase